MRAHRFLGRIRKATFRANFDAWLAARKLRLGCPKRVLRMFHALDAARCARVHRGDIATPNPLQEPGRPCVEMGARRRCNISFGGSPQEQAGGSRRLAYLRRSSGRRSDSRCLEANCVPQRACNGCARGPAVETRDTGNLSTRRAAAALRNALSREPPALRPGEPPNTKDTKASDEWCELPSREGT